MKRARGLTFAFLFVLLVALVAFGASNQYQTDFEFTADGDQIITQGVFEWLTFQFTGTFSADIQIYGGYVNSDGDTKWVALFASAKTSAGYATIKQEAFTKYKVNVSSYASGTVACVVRGVRGEAKQ